MPVKKRMLPMIKKTKLITELLILLISFTSCAQKIEVVKDTVFLNESYPEYEFVYEKHFELEELNIPSQNKNIYREIQEAYDIFNGRFFDNYKERLQTKKENLIEQLKDNTIREDGYAFESYTIYYNLNHLLNLSIGIQIYGSPWEDIRYYTFDMKKDESIGANLFKDHDQLLQLINKKIKETEDTNFQADDLSSYQLVTDDNGRLTSVLFLIPNKEEQTNNGNTKYEVSVLSSEIKEFISDDYKKQLFR